MHEHQSKSETKIFVSSHIDGFRALKCLYTVKYQLEHKCLWLWSCTMGSDESLVYLSGMMSITRVVTSQYEISKLAKVAFNGLTIGGREEGWANATP